MTTILADAKLGVMVADSNMTDGDRIWKVKKIHRIRGALVGLAGIMSEGQAFLRWFAADDGKAPEFEFGGSTALVLDGGGLFLFDENTLGLTKVPGGIESAGSGAVAAIAAYEALGFQDPVRAVRIACKHDQGSRPPVRSYKL